MRKNEYFQEMYEIREMFRNGEINADTEDLMLDDLDRRYPDEDPEESDDYPLDLSEYTDFE